VCHSIEVTRHLLTARGAARDSLTVKSVNAPVVNLKWTRPKYVEPLKQRLYRSAETGETVRFPAADLEDYVPPVARRTARKTDNPRIPAKNDPHGQRLRPITAA
jgi:hypothetical protein